VPKERYDPDNWYDVWFPQLSPTPELMAQGKASQSDEAWGAFVRQFRRQMSDPASSRTLDLLAALSKDSRFSIGCYCRDERRCHRSVLRALLSERGAAVI
jgi:uncharacterized protein YeaO (DUF488 family)